MKHGIPEIDQKGQRNYSGKYEFHMISSVGTMTAEARELSDNCTSAVIGLSLFSKERQTQEMGE
jgi:hypothetical protein